MKTSKKASVHPKCGCTESARATAHCLKKALGGFQAVCIILLCLYAAVHLPTFDMRFYEYQYVKNDVANTINISEAELLRVTAHMLDYMRGRVPDLQVTAVVAGEPRLFFSEREIYHMIDVYILFVIGDILRNIAIIGLLLAFGVAFYWRRYGFFAAYAKANVIVIAIFMALFAALAGIIALDFDTAFIIFHEIFFFNDLWILDPRVDLLINMVPLPFFIDLSMLIGVLFFGMLTIVLAASVWAWKCFAQVKNNE